MTTKMKTNQFGAGAGFLLLSLAACGSSTTNDGSSTGGHSASSTSSGGKSSTAGAGSAAKDAGSSTSQGGKSSTAGAGSTKTDAGKSSTGGAASTKTDAGTGLGSAAHPIELGTAGQYVMLAKTGISTVPTAVVTGNLGLSPAAASYITGFDLVADSTNVFAISPQVTGKVYAADYAVPTPSNMTTAVGDMELAFTSAAARAPDVTELGAGDIGGMTITPGVYKWGTGLLIPKDVTLSGAATAVWIFQVAQDLSMSSATKIVLTGGALAKNVFWQVAGSVVLDTTAHIEGVVLSQTSITLRTGASVKGRLLAQTAVTIDGSTVVEPAK